MFEPVKIAGRWKIRSLSPCFKPIVINGVTYETKTQAMRAARKASGLQYLSIQEFREHIRWWKDRFEIDRLYPAV